MEKKIIYPFFLGLVIVSCSSEMTVSPVEEDILNIKKEVSSTVAKMFQTAALMF